MPPPRAARQNTPAIPPVPHGAAFDFANARILALASLPLRLFMGFTFLYAGIDKIRDPEFLHPGTPGYLGTQLVAYAHGSPLGGFLTNVAVPNALLFAWFVTLGEIFIGLGALSGVLFRAAAFFGTLLSFILWLSTSWQTHPYFYSPDVFTLFAWLTLMLTGTGNLLALDPYIGRWLAQRYPSASVRAILSGLDMLPPQPATQTAGRGYQNAQSRRGFIQGVFSGLGAAIAAVILWRAVGGDTAASPQSATATATPDAGGGTGSTTTSGAIANANSMAADSAVPFTIPSNGDPAAVVKLKDGTIVAYDTVCTHAGCTVNYTAGGVFACPCHGAQFSASGNGRVLRGPARDALASVNVKVDQSTGDITLA